MPWAAHRMATRSPQGIQMAKTIKTSAELQSIIVSAVRGRPHCEDFRSIEVYRIDDKVDFNWGATNFDPGQSGIKSCEDALREIVPLLQRKYDLAE
jgi:hypothetical protein